MSTYRCRCQSHWRSYPRTNPDIHFRSLIQNRQQATTGCWKRRHFRFHFARKGPQATGRNHRYRYRSPILFNQVTGKSHRYRYWTGILVKYFIDKNNFIRPLFHSYMWCGSTPYNVYICFIYKYYQIKLNEMKKHKTFIEILYIKIRIWQQNTHLILKDSLAPIYI